MAVTSGAAPRLSRQYPHVEDITDWRAQQTIRLLWDRVFDLEARLQAVEATTGDLVSQSNSQEDQLTALRRQVGEALALAQLARAGDGGDSGTGAGLPAEAPNMTAVLESTLAAGPSGGGAWDLTVQLGPTGQSKFVEAVVTTLHGTDPSWGHVKKTGGQNGSVDHVPPGDGHAVDAINWKNPDGVTAEIYDIVSSGGSVQWIFDARTTVALDLWKYPA